MRTLVKPCAPFEVADGRPYIGGAREGSLTPRGVSYRSEDGAIKAKPRTHTQPRRVGHPKKVKEGFLTAPTPFAMTKFFGQLVVAADFVDDFGDDGFV